MKRLWFVGLTVLMCGAVGRAADNEAVVHLRATLTGLNEVPPTASNGTGEFEATISDGNISFSMTFEGLSANAQVSHIHFGRQDVNGGVMIFLCGGGGQPACPAATSGTIEGSIVPANVVGPAAQGITAGQLQTAIEEVLQGQGYVNIHTATFPAGEIRGQVRVPGAENDKR
jgi:CHRD domain-containing protein